MQSVSLSNATVANVARPCNATGRRAQIAGLRGPLRAGRKVAKLNITRAAVDDKAIKTEKSQSFDMTTGQRLENSGMGIRYIEGKDLSGLLAQGYKILDIRPPYEGPIKDAAVIPFLVLEDGTTAFDEIRRFSFEYLAYGWLYGNKLLKRNEKFSEQVEAAFAEDDKVVVVCGDGQRSRLAVKQLTELNGFTGLTWLKGGLEATRKGDVPAAREGADPRLGSVGGVVGSFGFSQVQLKDSERETGKATSKQWIDNAIPLAGLLAIAQLAVTFGPTILQLKAPVE